MTNITRSIGTAFLFMAALATTAAAAAPARATAPVAPTARSSGDGPRGGTIRAELRSGDGSRIPALITIERVYGKLDVVVVVEAPTALELTSVSDSTIVGKLPTQSGTATVTLHITDDGVTGTISEGRRVWTVSGVRTS